MTITDSEQTGPINLNPQDLPVSSLSHDPLGIYFVAIFDTDGNYKLLRGPWDQLEVLHDERILDQGRSDTYATFEFLTPETTYFDLGPQTDRTIYVHANRVVQVLLRDDYTRYKVRRSPQDRTIMQLVPRNS